ncbi:phage tail protein [Levilactobacillus brevis]|uniref:HK97 gp10 family phage protein n=1 Tax=Levilactobacillus brevis TaxID=1580 RepID=UPI0021A7B902|nr:HK97 gp10 family phage protein [Levilactobacillus brevis]MCT3589316.1 phage tail protein [Levilactobacillus brevis]
MASQIKNEASFDRLLDDLADGFGRKERLQANQAGAKQFEKVIRPKVPYRYALRKGESVHLRDSLISVENENGSAEVGFTKKSMKGYIARIVNDGWQPKAPYGRNKTSSYDRVPGQHFWEKAQQEAKGKVAEAVATSLKKSMDKKVER